MPTSGGNSGILHGKGGFACWKIIEKLRERQFQM